MYILRKEATSPTTASKLIITRGVIDAKTEYMMTLSTVTAFVQTEIVLEEYNIIIKIRVQLVNIHIENCPGFYDKHVWFK